MNRPALAFGAIALFAIVFAGLWLGSPSSTEAVEPRVITKPKSAKRASWKGSPQSSGSKTPQSDSPSTPRSPAEDALASFADKPHSLWPNAVEELVEEARRHCYDQSSEVEWVVECDEYPCIVMTWTVDGVRIPFCETLSEAPRFPPGARRSPIDLQHRRFTFGHPMVVEEDLEDEEIREQIRVRTERLAIEWFER